MIRYLLALPLKLLFSFVRLLSGPKVSRSLTAEESTRKYIQSLAHSTEATHLPLLSTSYADAVEQAKRELQILLVVITSSHHDETPACHAQILQSSALQTFVQEHTILCWAGDAADREAFLAASALGATRYPFFAVLVYNTLRSPAGVSCISKIDGLVQAADLIALLTTSLERFEPTLIAARLDRREQNASREIRREQDSAYERSLAADRRRAEEARQAAAEQAAQLAERERKEQGSLRFRAWRHAQVLPEPAAGGLATVARVSLRMPDGSRVVRRFEATCAVEEMYAFVDAKLHPLTEAEQASIGEVLEDPGEDAYSYPFTLAVPMPRRIVACAKDIQIADTKEVFPSGSLIVEAIEADLEESS